ncbi:hypothetical protein JIN84_22565 [Luteolibacter yonseiensis]|uniref:Uncharacterized protein n=1 Tax=Luteolibacter yonseiensis TaxID=1144680 RepID=A0A934RBA8_9BACT|nr:hypothetical protein [Luteolibacter yonseiensis]MBK1818419.1 hypothetical protein [Luteolibacter yonseiensis]
MWKLLLIFSVLPILAAMASRWWFGLRVLADEGRRQCRCIAGKGPSPGDADTEKSAAEFGRELRLLALEEWRERDLKAANSRENSRRFGMAVPPMSGIIAIFAVIVGRVIPMGGFTIFASATAISCAFGLLSLAPELRAIAVTARRFRTDKNFPRRDDEDAVVNCAIAHAWKETLPPVLSLIQK